MEHVSCVHIVHSMKVCIVDHSGTLDARIYPTISESDTGQINVEKVWVFLLDLTEFLHFVENFVRNGWNVHTSIGFADNEEFVCLILRKNVIKTLEEGQKISREIFLILGLGSTP